MGKYINILDDLKSMDNINKFSVTSVESKKNKFFRTY